MESRTFVSSRLKKIHQPIQEKVSELLGRQVALSQLVTRLVSREEALAGGCNQLALAGMTVGGDRQGEAFLLIDLKDAVLLGGTLILLPATELERRVADEELTDEEADAFGEIVNLITGILTDAFNEHFPTKLRFKKADLKIVDPARAKGGLSQPLPRHEFYLASCSMSMDGRQLGQLRLLLPVPLVEVESVEPATNPTGEEAVVRREPGGHPPILVIAQSLDETRPLVDALTACAIETRCLAYRDKVREFLQGNEVRGVFQVMSEVNEQGLAVAIQIRATTASSTPLVVAGPQWTRKTVLQAIKYGACDILVTPAEAGEIEEKVRQHMALPPS